jgi:hypothetical protein
MSKKIVIPIVVAAGLALIAGLAFSGVALAQGEGPLARLLAARPVLGKVIVIGDARFTVKARNGVELTFTVDENTRYRSKDQTDLAFSDLKTGLWLAIVPVRGTSVARLARLVVILPADFNPTQFEGARGQVVSVDPATGQFTIENRSGQETVINTNAETQYRGQVSGLSDLQAGMPAGVITKQQPGDGEVAQVVRAGNPITVYFGELTTVSSASFNLKTLPDGQQLTVAVDANTRFRIKGSQMGNLEDLQIGMEALIVSKTTPADGQANGSPQAVLVAAFEASALPKADLWVSGRVVSVALGSITVECQNGKQYAFQVSSATRVRSQAARTVSDLKPGMLALVGAMDLGNGAYQAQFILALPRGR